MTMATAITNDERARPTNEARPSTSKTATKARAKEPGAQLALIKKPKGRALMRDVVRDSTALVLPEGLTFVQWQKLGRPLLEAGHSMMWWIGDWLNYGEARYASRYTEMAEWTGLDEGTLADAKWVSASVPSSLREEALSFSHHKAVAPLGADAQRALLRRALDESMSVNGLRAAVREHRGEVRDAVMPSLFAEMTLRLVVPSSDERAAREVMDLAQRAITAALTALGIEATVEVR